MSEHRAPTPEHAPASGRPTSDARRAERDRVSTLAIPLSRLPVPTTGTHDRPVLETIAAQRRRSRLALALRIFATLALVAGLITIAGGVILLLR